MLYIDDLKLFVSTTNQLGIVGEFSSDTDLKFGLDAPLTRQRADIARSK